MVSKKVIIGAVVVVAIIAVAAIAIGGSDDTPEARYNYKIELTNSFIGGSGLEETPDAGMQYAIVTYHVYNDSYKSGMSTNLLTWVWSVTANNLSYTSSLDTFSHPGYQLVDVAVGGNATQVIVFEIPSTITMEDLTVTQDYQWTFDTPKLKLDESITV